MEKKELEINNSKNKNKLIHYKINNNSSSNSNSSDFNNTQLKLLDYIKINYGKTKIEEEFILGPNWILIKATEEDIKNNDVNQYYHSKDKTCILCGSIFKYGQSQKVLCDCCKIITECFADDCKKIFEVNLSRYAGTKQREIIKAIQNREMITLSCSKSCGNKIRKSHGTCPNCHHEDVDIYNGRCTYCANKELNSSINCPIHGFQEYSFGGKCILCINAEKDYEKQTKIRVENINKQIENGERLYWPGGNQFIPSFIEKDDKVLFYLRDKGEFIEVHELYNKLEEGDEINPDDYGFVKISNNWYFHKINILTKKIIETNLSNKFIEIEGIKCYKINGFYYTIKEIIEKLDSGEYSADGENKDFNGWNLRYCKTCGRETWHYFSTCLLCESINKLPTGHNSNFITKDNVKFYKGEELSNLVRKILNDEIDINNYPEFEIRNGHVCYNCRDVLTNIFVSMKNNFNIINKKKFYKDEPVEVVCEEILNKTRNISSYPGFEIICGRVTYNKFDILTDEPIYLNSNFQVVYGVKFYKNTPAQEIADGILNKSLNIDDYPGFNIRLGRVCYGTHDVLTDETIYLQQNFQTRDGVKFYKNEPIEDVIAKLESGEYNTIDNCPGWNKRFGEWYYGTVNVLTGEITTLNGSNFETRNDVLYYYDVEVGDYVPWDEYKTEFETRMNNRKVADASKNNNGNGNEDSKNDVQTLESFLETLKRDFPTLNPYIQLTYRTQESENWEGASGAFEQSLLDNGIKWFSYIKFYKTSNESIESKPIVCGKTGSKDVNDGGSDVNFSLDVNNGPSRRYLYDNPGYVWNKEEIIIIPCSSEGKAYEIETKIQRKYWLFGS